jgi:hypothetical protein
MILSFEAHRYTLTQMTGKFSLLRMCAHVSNEIFRIFKGHGTLCAIREHELAMVQAALFRGILVESQVSAEYI